MAVPQKKEGRYPANVKPAPLPRLDGYQTRVSAPHLSQIKTDCRACGSILINGEEPAGSRFIQ